MSPLRGSERKLSCAVGGRKEGREERGRRREGLLSPHLAVRSSGQVMGKRIKDEEVTVKVEKQIFAAVNASLLPSSPAD